MPLPRLALAQECLHPFVDFLCRRDSGLRTRHATSVWQGTHFQLQSTPYQRPLSNTRPPPAPPELSKNVLRPACASVGPSIGSGLG